MSRSTGKRFHASNDGFRLAWDALRLRNLAAYEPMAAVESSAIQPLPHQIRAVYDDLLPKVPLRFLLADDPGAGKTVMAGLYIKEMLMRGAAERVAIVVPGGLAEQWQRELHEKFNLDFMVFSPTMSLAAAAAASETDGVSAAEHMTAVSAASAAKTASGIANPFAACPRLILRMDQIARNDDYMAWLRDVHWDIAIVDEAHRMSATFRNADGAMERTSRFKLGEVLASTAENLLLMTATPHAGKEEDFQLFMSLLDPDRFAGRYTASRHRQTDTAGLMRRMVKEDMRTFGGEPLFPPRHAQSVAYELSEEEAALYGNVTAYVRTGFNAIDRIRSIGNGRGNAIGFALTMLQRRLASSPEAVLRSLERRRERLRSLRARVAANPAALDDAFSSDEGSAAGSLSVERFDDRWDNAGDEARTRLEEQASDVEYGATWASSLAELDGELRQLDALVKQARDVRASGVDAKWMQLADLLQRNVLDEVGEHHKLIVFTEHRDTLDYLQRRIANLLGRPEAVETIHGGMTHAEREAVQQRFSADPSVRILVATDAAGEGLNLQCADIVINYDLPWNPNRIEQRFGRIHRIGQRRPCFLFNMVAKNTREGDVYIRLLDKIATIGNAYEGRLFNVLGDGKAFDGKPLRELMIEAIRHGDEPAQGERLQQAVEEGVVQSLAKLADERALVTGFGDADLRDVRHALASEQERRQQPAAVGAFAFAAFRELGVSFHARETGLWEISRIPARVRKAASCAGCELPRSYRRVAFDPDVAGDGIELLAPGHPLLDACIHLVAERYGSLLDQGAVFVDRTENQPDSVRFVAAVSHGVADEEGRLVDGRFDYVAWDAGGEARLCAAPALADFAMPADGEWERIEALLSGIGAAAGIDSAVKAQDSAAAQRLEKAANSRRRHEYDQIDRRLSAESNFWWGKCNELKEDLRKGRTVSMRPAYAQEKAEQFEARRNERLAQLAEPVHRQPAAPVVHGIVAIVPGHMLQAEEGDAAAHAKDVQLVDERAVAAVMAAERAAGRAPVEMPHNNPGYDIRSEDADGNVLFIEVKGRIAEPEPQDFVITRTEMRMAVDMGGQYRLALVKVSPDGPQADELRYVRRPFGAGDVLGEDFLKATPKFKPFWERGEVPGSSAVIS